MPLNSGPRLRSSGGQWAWEGVLTGLGRSRLRSSSAHCNQELARRRGAEEEERRRRRELS